MIGSKADYRRSDYLFPREQSRSMQELSWEVIEESWLSAWLNAGGFVLFLAAILGMICMGGGI